MKGLLSQTQLIKLIPILVKRDGRLCLYCEKEVDPQSCIVEHLNDNPTDNRIQNLILAHQSCNIKKITNKSYKEKAEEKLYANIDANYHVVDAKQLESILNNEEKNEDLTEIEINERNRDVVEQYLIEKTQNDSSIEVKKAVASCVYLCIKKTSHGSHQAVYRYIDLFTCDEAPFEIRRDANNKRVIVKRTSGVFSPSHSSSSEEIST